MSSEIVQAFLIEQYNKKTEKEQKQLIKAKEKGDIDQIATLEAKLNEARDKYRTNTWLSEAVYKMAKQLQFGTHISKGVHPDAKGDNISFQPKHDLPECVVGTHSVESRVIDANGNAAALPLAAFFDFALGEGNDAIKIRDLILRDNADFIASLAPHPDTARDYHRIFKDILQNVVENPVTHARNKQILWANNPDAKQFEELTYTALVPLYPSVFTHEVYLRINQLRYSEANKMARENRFKKTEAQRPYVSLPDIASVTLGGTKPQNVSQLMSRQGGRNYLLPSMPPMITQDYDFHLSKFADSIFNQRLAFYAREEIQEIYDVVNHKKSVVKVRETRKLSVDAVLHILFAFVKKLQNRPAGWSKDYELNPAEKFWLDPKRAELPEEQRFKKKREKADWQREVIEGFAYWMNALLHEKFPDLKHDIGTPEYHELVREIEAMIKQYQRWGEEVFV